MRVAVVHSYYSSRQPSGENVVVDLQVDALRRAGHDVRVFARRTDELDSSPLYPVRAGLRVATGRGYSPAEGIDEFAPDIVHVHNLFPNFGRTWLSRYASRLVVTVHNYRPICPAGTLFRDGHSCTLCPDGGSARPAVKYACYKDSRLATLPVARGTQFAEDPMLASAARLVTLNDDMRRQYAEVGVPADRMVTVPNFVSGDAAPGDHDGGYWLFVGRLSEEKGILRLLHDWPAGEKLKVAGAGPLEARVAAAAAPDVELLGQVPNAEVRRLLGAAQGLVFPSLWPEGLPTIYLEALAAGTPVLASPQSIVGRLVAEEGTGIVAAGSFADELATATAAFPGLRERCRATYDEKYTEQAWVAAIEKVYAAVRHGH